MLGGIGAKDDLCHYLSCPNLLAIVDEISQCSLGSSVAHRLLLRSPTTVAAIQLATMFDIYHTLKGGYKPTIVECLRCHRFAPVGNLARDISRLSYNKYKHTFSTSQTAVDSVLIEVAPGVFVHAGDPILEQMDV